MSTPAAKTAPSPSTNLSLTDRTTWLMIFSIVAAIVANLFHKDLSGYEQLGATIAAGVIAAAVAFSKHHYAAAIAGVTTTVTNISNAVPSSAPTDLRNAVKVVVDAQAQLTSAAQSFGAIASLVAHSGLPAPAAAVAGQVASDIAEVVPPVGLDNPVVQPAAPPVDPPLVANAST